MNTPNDLSPHPVKPSAPTAHSTPPLQGFVDSATADKSSHEEITHRAYSIWECAGRPDDSALSHWLKAQAEVMAEI
jgi:hypothetical protein